ncbi:MAG: hypothetical protein PVH19_03915 [Planctomycetia bacterium]
MTLFLVVCYVLAVTVSALFHNHGIGNSEPCCCPMPSQAGDGGIPAGSYNCDRDHDHRHSTQPVPENQNTGSHQHTPGESQISGMPGHTGLCPVCSFLAQKTLASEVPPVIAWTMLDKACDPKLPLAPTLLPPYSWYGRAPPLES